MKLNTHLLRILLTAFGAFAAAPGMAATINVPSCSQTAVQSAINAAADGDTIVVPAGSCTWSSSVQISGKGVHLKGATKGSVNITHSAGSSDLIGVTTDASHHVEISNLNFVPGGASGTAEYISVSDGGGSDKPALVHDNYFRTVGFTVGCMSWSAKGGVIWNNTFEALESNGSSGGCLQLKSPGRTSSWTTASTMGIADLAGTSNVYIENNVFKKIILQAIDVDDNMRAVIRYNQFDNSGFVYHGADTSSSGVRHVEVYNNKFIFTTSGSGYSYPLNLNWWGYMRGGTGVWADNEMPAIASQMWGSKSAIKMIVQNLRRAAGPYACWSSYPAPHQIGQSHNGAVAITDPVYIWGNTGSGSQTPGLDDYSPNECGGGASTATFVRVGRDFVVGVPKPGYAKYVYPHPLTRSSASSAGPLSAPTSLRVL